MWDSILRYISACPLITIDFSRVMDTRIQSDVSYVGCMVNQININGLQSPGSGAPDPRCTCHKRWWFDAHTVERTLQDCCALCSCEQTTPSDFDRILLWPANGRGDITVDWPQSSALSPVTWTEYLGYKATYFDKGAWTNPDRCTQAVVAYIWWYFLWPKIYLHIIPLCWTRFFDWDRFDIAVRPGATKFLYRLTGVG